MYSPFLVLLLLHLQILWHSHSFNLPHSQRCPMDFHQLLLHHLSAAERSLHFCPHSCPLGSQCSDDCRDWRLWLCHHWHWNNPKGHSVNWDSRESKIGRNRPKVLAVGSGGILTGYDGERPRELDWSSLAGTCGLLYYYICKYMFVPDLLMNVLEYSGI